MDYTRFLPSLLLIAAMAPVSTLGAEFDPGDRFSDSLDSGGTGPEMVVLRGGSFVLGGGQPGQHDLGVVKIRYRIAIGATEITLGQYRQFLKATRSAHLRDHSEGNDTLPVSGISWDEAEAYVTWLSRETGHHYRLPSASEWEYAARAGTNTLYHWGDEPGKNKANCLTCDTEFAGEVAPVGSFPANAWGLSDMHGNVWEWTKDCIDPNTAPPSNGMPKLFGNCDSRELRGGSARSDAWSIRAGARAFALRMDHISDVGFRVVMDISQR